MRAAGVEPTFATYKVAALPLSYTRFVLIEAGWPLKSFDTTNLRPFLAPEVRITTDFVRKVTDSVRI